MKENTNHLKHLINDNGTKNEEAQQITQYINYGRVNHREASTSSITHIDCNHTNSTVSDKHVHCRGSSTKRYVIDPRHYDGCEQQDESPFSAYHVKFVKFQKKAAIESHKDTFCVETHVQHMMVLNNTLLLKPDQACGDLESIFTVDGLREIASCFRDVYKIEAHVLDAQLERNVKVLVLVGLRSGFDEHEIKVNSQDYMHGKTNNRQASRLLANIRSAAGIGSGIFKPETSHTLNWKA